MSFTLEDIFNLPNAVIYYPDRYKSTTSVSIDTRSIKKNAIFVAIKGQKFDGHSFVKDAIKKGAKAIIVSNRKLKLFDDVNVPIISVKNTLDAYAELAKIYRNKLNAKVISITGSNGKTSTKEILTHLLSAKYKVHKTLANNNNQIGVPLTILSAPKNTEIIVVEHGTNHFGEINYTAKIAQPDIALITNIGNSHTKFLISKERILEEKSRLFDHLKTDGFVFINSDDTLLKKLKVKNAKITFGYKGKCDVKGFIKNVREDGTQSISVEGFNKKLEVKLPLIGESNFKNYISAVSIALKLGISKKDIIKQTSSLAPVKGRVQKTDYKNFAIIDDTYNSNPDSVLGAIKLLSSMNRYSERIIVFGDMFELGKASSKHHIEIAKEIKKLDIDSVLTLGKESKKIVRELDKLKSKKHFYDRKSLKRYLQQMELNNSIILFKGSRGMRMEEFVKTLEKRAA